MDRHMKIYDFPENQRMELNDGIYSITSKFAVESAKKFDGMICDAIAKAAKDAGVTKLAILDAKGIVEAFKRLAAYEDAEVEGRLVVLPCKVRDAVYCIRKNPYAKGKYVKENKVLSITWDERFFSLFTTKEDVLGKTVFLTREEAEEALRRKTNE